MNANEIFMSRKIARYHKEVEALMDLVAEKDKEIERLKGEIDGWKYTLEEEWPEHPALMATTEKQEPIKGTWTPISDAVRRSKEKKLP